MPGSQNRAEPIPTTAFYNPAVTWVREAPDAAATLDNLAKGEKEDVAVAEIRKPGISEHAFAIPSGVVPPGGISPAALGPYPGRTVTSSVAGPGCSFRALSAV